METGSVTKNGTVTTPSKTIEKGVVVFEDGKITAVDQRNRVKVPRSACIHMPGGEYALGQQHIIVCTCMHQG